MHSSEHLLHLEHFKVDCSGVILIPLTFTDFSASPLSSQSKILAYKFLGVDNYGTCSALVDCRLFLAVPGLLPPVYKTAWLLGRS
jgi:hypothetical protein